MSIKDERLEETHRKVVLFTTDQFSRSSFTHHLEQYCKLQATLRTSAYLTMPSPCQLVSRGQLSFRLTIRGFKLHQPIRYARAIFRVRVPTKTSFTANANQSNESVTRARVASTEVCVCHRE